jgi:hypothetical protein
MDKASFRQVRPEWQPRQTFTEMLVADDELDRANRSV